MQHFFPEVELPPPCSIIAATRMTYSFSPALPSTTRMLVRGQQQQQQNDWEEKEKQTRRMRKDHPPFFFSLSNPVSIRNGKLFRRKRRENVAAIYKTGSDRRIMPVFMLVYSRMPSFALQRQGSFWKVLTHCDDDLGKDKQKNSWRLFQLFIKRMFMMSIKQCFPSRSRSRFGLVKLKSSLLVKVKKEEGNSISEHGSSVIPQRRA